MKEKKNQSGERGYRFIQDEGKITWRIEELWNGGVTRGPFGAREFAVQREENIARTEGFFDNLVLKEAIGEEKSLSDAFEKDSDGNWHCINAISIEMENRMIVIAEGMTFTKGVQFMGVDVAQWLDENYS
jgi:hypothetical protein